jgi:sterol desaturase/sphingolipid hydroxylase (fatty acid hydroxylase superfamily)
MAHHLPVDHSAEPIRLFKSNYLEFFTHVDPLAIVAIWVPFGGYFLVGEILAGIARGASLWYVPAAYLVGLFVWSLAEYLLHRFVFHYKPRGPFQEKVIYLFHGIHHHQPQIKTRLVMPPIVSIPLAGLFYGLFTLIFSNLLGLQHWFGPMIAGFTTGYLIYDLTHYATHHFPMRSGVLKYLKRYHMMHHFKTPDKRFGVSSPLWDYVFATKPE